MDLSKVEKPLVLFHGPGCRDGWCSAFLAHLRFGEGTDLVPQEYGDPAGFDGSRLLLRVRGESRAFDLEGRDVLMLDWAPQSRTDPAFTGAILDGIASRARSLFVGDHHEKMGPALLAWEVALPPGPNVRVVFDPKRSGCGIALDEFFPGARQAIEEDRDWESDLLSFTTARLALVCEDWDTWRFSFPRTKAICAFVDTVEKDVHAWRAMTQCNRVDDMAERGAAVLAYQRQQVERITKHARSGSLRGAPFAGVNTPVLQSEVCEALYEVDPTRAALAWYLHEDGHVAVSLRSKTGVGPDVGAIAQGLGGGGHRHSSGFKVPTVGDAIQLGVIS